MKILVTGATGLVGSALCERLKAEGHEVVALRMPRFGSAVAANSDPPFDSAKYADIGAVVHLAGENIAGRWTQAKKDRIWYSRVRGTQWLVRKLLDLPQKPSVLVCASAVGAYGDQGDKVVTEATPTPSGFFPDLAREWEAAAQVAQSAGIRVVQPRLGVILSRKGGALHEMLMPFKLGLGGRIASGKQWWSWVALKDVVRFVTQAVADRGLEGIYNLTSPNPVTNAQFTKALGRVLRRPTVIPVPGFALRLVFKDLADAAMLSSVRAVPARLQETDFEFNHPEIEGALKAALANESLK